MAISLVFLFVCVLESMKDFVYVPWDTHIDMFCRVIPANLDAAELFADSAHGDVLILLFEGLD